MSSHVGSLMTGSEILEKENNFHARVLYFTSQSKELNIVLESDLFPWLTVCYSLHHIIAKDIAKGFLLISHLYLYIYIYKSQFQLFIKDWQACFYNVISYPLHQYAIHPLILNNLLTEFDRNATTTC